MDKMTARPQILKQANLSLIRRVIKSKGSVTRAEIAWETKISSTTVRSLLTQMQHNGEIESIGLDESSGGRKAERYRFKMDRYYGAAFCITEDVIHYLIVNICGEIVESGQLEPLDGDMTASILVFLDEFPKQKEIKAIGLGVPGIVDGGGYLKKDVNSKLYKVELCDRLIQKYRLPIIMENDLNAITIGFGQCYEKKYPREGTENTNMAFLYFEEDCVSAGFLAGGRILRGWKHYAGEIGLITEDEKTLSERLLAADGTAEYINLVVRIISWICGILNPQYVALGGPAFKKECLAQISDELYSVLPRDMYAEILYSADVWHDYYGGMAYLTAGRMFDEVQFVKEQP